MSLDKLIAAATDYFSTGAEVHRRTLAGGGCNATEMSETKVGTTSDTAKPKLARTQGPTAVPKHREPEAEPAAAAVQVPVPDAVTDVVAKPAVVEDDLDGGGEVLDYEADIRPLLRAKTLTNREGLIALLGTFGVKSGAELTATQYPAFFAGLKAL